MEEAGLNLEKPKDGAGVGTAVTSVPSWISDVSAPRSKRRLAQVDPIYER